MWSSVRDSIVDSVWSSVWGSVWNSVRDSVRDSIVDSVWNSVGNSVWDFAYAYISSFFNIPYSYDFTSTVKLWEKGLVPSFDGKKWRLHRYKGKIVWEGKI